MGLEVCSLTKITLKSTQIFLVATVVLMALFITVLCIGFMVRYEVDTDVSDVESIRYWKENLAEEQQIWYKKGIEELRRGLYVKSPKQQAKNVLLFFVRGISPEALAAVRFGSHFSKNTIRAMLWEKFPNLGRLKNSCSALDICDPFSVATALFGGVKTNFKVGGYDAAINFRNCASAMLEEHKVESILRQAEKIGLRTGFVTTQRVTGPTVAALYAHTPDTSWECDATMPKGPLTKGCEDVAQQLVTGVTGSQLNVIIGGGRQALVSNTPKTLWDPIDESVCHSKVKRNLMSAWQSQKMIQKQQFQVLQNAPELARFNGSKVDFLLGLFANGDLRPLMQTPSEKHPIPTLLDMVKHALDVLIRPNVGYVLIVDDGIEAGRSLMQQIEELEKLDHVLQQTFNSKSYKKDETLTLVTFTNGVYLKNAIDTSAETDTVLSFADFAEDDIELDKRFQELFTDTLVYARGPKSYLFDGIHEETYMAHAISHVLKMGPFNRSPKSESNKSE